MSRGVPDQTNAKNGAPRGWLRAAVASCLASFLASLLLTLALPPFGAWPLAFVAPIPLLWAGRGTVGKGWLSAAGATVGAVPALAWQEQWIFGVSAIGAALLVPYLALYSGAFVWITRRTAARWNASVWLVGPVVWSGLEMFRGEVAWHGYPWFLAGHPVIGSLRLAHAASVVGAYGVSFLTVCVAAGLGAAIFERRRLRPLLWLTAVALIWAGLASIPGVHSKDSLRVAAIQTNVAQSVKGVWTPQQRMGDLDEMLDLSMRACDASPRPELVIWPETMFPGSALDEEAIDQERQVSLNWTTPSDSVWPALRHLVWRGEDGQGEPQRVTGPVQRGDRLAMPTSVAADSLFVWQAKLGVPFLIGAEGTEGLTLSVRDSTGAIEEHHEAFYNSTFLVDGGRVVGDRYDKIHLTPFGEVMPYVSEWPWLESLMLRIGVGASGMSFDLDAGARPTLHDVSTPRGTVRVATPICFEGIMPGLCRRLVYAAGARRADVLIQLTNEGWFGGFDTGRLQHLQIVRWRAIELGTSVVRVANTGICAIIDPEGQVLVEGTDAGLSNVEGVVAGSAPLAAGGTIYGCVGDAVGWSNLTLTGVVFVFGLVRGRRSQSRGPRKSDEQGESGRDGAFGREDS